MGKLKRIRQGDRLKGLPEDTWNSFGDAAQRVFQSGGPGNGPGVVGTSGPSIPVMVENASGENRDQFEILGIDAPIFTIEDDEDVVQTGIHLKGVIPKIADHRSSHVVLQAPIEKNDIGPAILTGATWCKVDVTEESHKHALLTDGDASKLTSDICGSPILWKEDGVGEKWAIVNVSHVPETGITFLNFSGETIPPYGIIAAFKTDGDEAKILARKPLGVNYSGGIVQWFVNSGKSVPASSEGLCFYPAETPALLQVESDYPASWLDSAKSFGPVSGQWLGHPGLGFFLP